MRQRPGILVLCTGNSARSQMAEALIRKHLGADLPVYSAGTEPAAGVHPLAVRALEEAGLDASGQHPKHVRDFLGKLPLHTVIMVCADADRKCPAVWPGAHQRLSWPFPDPAAAEGTEEERLQVFRDTRDAIERQVRDWIDAGEAPGA